MDPTLITKIAAAGSMGVSILCIFKVYKLLKREQEKEKPSPTMTKSIIFFMIFAGFMTLVSIGIEWIRYDMDTTSILSKVISIENQTYYSVNSNGNPEKIRLKHRDIEYNLSDPFPENRFEDVELKLGMTGTDNNLPIVKHVNNKQVILGHITHESILQIINSLKTKSSILVNPNELLNLGIYHSPTYEFTKKRQSEDVSRACNYLIELLKIDSKDSKSSKEWAIKLLTQRELMYSLEPDQYDVLVNALTSGIRSSPYDLYELAQVYFTRYTRTSNEEYLNKYLDTGKKYIAFYEGTGWIHDKDKYKRQHEWYLKFIKDITS